MRRRWYGIGIGCLLGATVLGQDTRQATGVKVGEGSTPATGDGVGGEQAAAMDRVSSIRQVIPSVLPSEKR